MANPTQTDKARAQREARLAREAAALRANLLRRKQQARVRATATEPAPAPDAAHETVSGDPSWR